MRPCLPDGLNNLLLWNDEEGRGFCGAELLGYGPDYWEKYVEYDKTEFGSKLTKARLDMIDRHRVGCGVDIGIGAGRFVEESGFFGFDVNLNAIEWLQSQGRYHNPYVSEVDSITCWDSLEHVPDMDALLRQVIDYAFVSMPIYSGFYDCLKSKHFRPGEHIHYFTHNGLIRYFGTQGFVCLEFNDCETEIGREGIRSFAFKRVRHV